MDSQARNQRKNHSKKTLLTLYLSVGIIGICMLAFSAWTPLTVHSNAAENSGSHNQSEHVPGNLPTDSSSDQNSNEADTITGEAILSPSPTTAPLNEKPSPTPTVTPTPTPTSTPTPTPNPLRTDAYDEVNNLIESYYSAKLSGESADFEPIVSDVSAIDIDYLHIQYGLVTDFSNFTCYTKNGINEIAYVVYVAYDSKIVTINTPVPALDRLTLVYAADGSGKLLVNTASELSDEANAYLNELSTHDDVQKMYENETKRFEDAVNSDPDLRQLYNRLDTEGAD